MFGPSIVQEHPGFGRVIVYPTICDGCGKLEPIIVRSVFKIDIEEGKLDGCDLIANSYDREEGWWSYRYPDPHENVEEDHCYDCVRGIVTRHIFLEHLKKEGNKGCLECFSIKYKIETIDISTPITDTICESYDCEHSGYVKSQLTAALIISDFSNDDIRISMQSYIASKLEKLKR